VKLAQTINLYRVLWQRQYLRKKLNSSESFCIGMSLSLHQRESSFVEIVTPVFPRFVSRSLTDAEDTIVIGAPDSTASNDDSHNTHPFRNGLRCIRHLSPARVRLGSLPSHGLSGNYCAREWGIMSEWPTIPELSEEKAVFRDCGSRLRHSGPITKEEFMTQFSQLVSTPIGVFLVLAVAAYLEVQGDACFQSGLYHSSGTKQIGWFVAGTVVLVCYSLFLNSSKIDLRQAFGNLCGAVLPRCPNCGKAAISSIA
jgi:hypothetical protein